MEEVFKLLPFDSFKIGHKSKRRFQEGALKLHRTFLFGARLKRCHLQMLNTLRSRNKGLLIKSAQLMSAPCGAA